MRTHRREKIQCLKNRESALADLLNVYRVLIWQKESYGIPEFSVHCSVQWLIFTYQLSHIALQQCGFCTTELAGDSFQFSQYKHIHTWMSHTAQSETKLSETHSEVPPVSFSPLYRLNSSYSVYRNSWNGRLSETGQTMANFSVILPLVAIILEHRPCLGFFIRQLSDVGAGHVKHTVRAVERKMYLHLFDTTSGQNVYHFQKNALCYWNSPQREWFLAAFTFLMTI